MQRFSIENRLEKVSFNQFKKTAEELESALKNVRPMVTSKLSLTTNKSDYDGYGSLSVVVPESVAAWKRKEKYQLSNLNEVLWRKSFEIELCLQDNSVEESYMVCLRNEVREPKKMVFYSQCLDEESQKVFENFRKAEWTQKIEDGFSKLTDLNQLNLLSSALSGGI